MENDAARFGHGMGGGIGNKNSSGVGGVSGAVMGYNYGVGMGISSGAGGVGDDSLSVSRR